MISVSLFLLLVGIAIGSNHLKDNENTSLQSPERKRFSLEKPRANMIVSIEAAHLVSILTYKLPLRPFNGAHTYNFLSEFNQFLIPFTWNDPQQNEVMKFAANYNKNHFGSEHNESIRLWISFQPRNDIKDDIEMVLDAIGETNLICSGTVTAVVLNYGLLQLDHESLLLVNHEIIKVKTTIKSMKNETIKFALQLDIINCKSGIDFFTKLEFKHVDYIFFSVPTKDLVLESENDFFLVMMAHLSCLQYLTRGKLPTVHTHMPIKISLHNGSYDYNRNMTKAFDRYGILESTPIIFWTEWDNQDWHESTKHHHVKTGELSSSCVNWLEQPIQFNQLHLGAVISAKEDQPAFTSIAIFENFHKVIIEIDGYTPDERKYLQQTVTELLNHSPSTRRPTILKDDLDEEKHVPLQVTLLVVITKNDFEVIKKQVDNAVWTIAYANKLVPGSVIGIAFDWNACSISEECSGHVNTNPNIYCSFFKMDRDLDKLYSYAKFALSKVKNLNTLRLWDIMDVNVMGKLLKTTVNRGCKPDETRQNLRGSAFKFSLSEKELTENGVVKTFNTITTKFSQYIELFDTVKIPVPYHYVKIVGCNANYSSASQLTDFVLLYEKLNTWAVSNNQTLYVDAGIENPAECQNKRKASSQVNCRCGWWVADSGLMGISHQSPVNVLGKKTLALNLYESKLNARPATKGKPVAGIGRKKMCWILVPCLLLVASVVLVTVTLVLRYQSKYIMTKDEIANFLKGRLRTNAGGEENSTPETEPYDSTKYELVLSSFTIDKSACVGKGEFGKVFRGSIKRAGKSVVSAVKVANTRALGKSYGGRVALFGLLSEVKILSYLGEHDHIVALLGAFTANLRNGEILIFLEFCELGSLYSYLHSIKPRQVVAERSSEDVGAFPLTNPNNAQCNNPLDHDVCNELYSYCGQVANGMEFLASKNVVHADLATRNILLTGEKVVKISDFGLSRRMYDYTEYVKQNQAPLPWRWMAPESLRKLVFNEKSDVWSFGITLWEIFMLGDEPYPGLSYDVNFPAMLARGLRLPAPKYNVKQVYAVMIRCWDTYPAERPTFAELNEELNK